MPSQLPPAFSAGSAPPELDDATETPDHHDPAPSYQAPSERYGGDIWAHWNAVDSANLRVTEVQEMLAELEPELEAQTKEFKRLKEKSATLFQALHSNSRPIVPNALRRLRSGSIAKRRESMEMPRQDFELAHQEETSVMIRVDTLRERIQGLKKQAENNMALASEADQVFELLGGSVLRTISNSAPHISAAEQCLADLSSRHDSAQKLVTDLSRAEVTVQHAHHYYQTVLTTIDAVRGTALGRAAFGGLGEMSKNKDYQVAAETAGKAQICFNETVRVLTPHAATLIPPDVLPDFEKLKEMGLLQATKIYGLMYGWQRASSGVAKSMKLMLQKQETVFTCLTRFAVWVQKRVPVAEAELRAARAARDQGRRDLAAAWKVEVEVAQLESEGLVSSTAAAAAAAAGSQDS